MSNMSGTDQEGVEVGENHEQILAGSWGSVELLIVGLVSLNSDSDRGVGLEHLLLVSHSVDQDVLVALEHHHWFAAVLTLSGELNLKLHLSTVGGDLVSEEPLRKAPVLGDSVGGSLKSEVSGLKERVLVIAINGALLHIGHGDSFGISSEHKTVLNSIRLRCHIEKKHGRGTREYTACRRL